jgi:hypothetical protein
MVLALARVGAVIDKAPIAAILAPVISVVRLLLRCCVLMAVKEDNTVMDIP